MFIYSADFADETCKEGMCVGFGGKTYNLNN